MPEQEQKRIRAFVLNHLDGILKQPHSFIHYPFIDPGSVYDGNVWDTYWSVYGLRATGSLHEYYDPFTGRPVMNGGFVNGNILALNMISELQGQPAINLAEA